MACITELLEQYNKVHRADEKVTVFFSCLHFSIISVVLIPPVYSGSTNSPPHLLNVSNTR